MVLGAAERKLFGALDYFVVFGHTPFCFGLF